MEFHERLAGLRKGTGLNQKQFAEKLNMLSSKYNKWENGTNKPDFDSICLLARTFHVSTDYLLGYSECKTPENESIAKETGLSERAIETLKKIKDAPENEVINFLLESESFLWLMELFSLQRDLFFDRYDPEKPFVRLEKNPSRYDNPYTEQFNDERQAANAFAKQQIIVRLSQDFNARFQDELLKRMDDEKAEAQTPEFQEKSRQNVLKLIEEVKKKRQKD